MKSQKRLLVTVIVSTLSAHMSYTSSNLPDVAQRSFFQQAHTAVSNAASSRMAAVSHCMRSCMRSSYNWVKENPLKTMSKLFKVNLLASRGYTHFPKHTWDQDYRAAREEAHKDNLRSIISTQYYKERKRALEEERARALAEEAHKRNLLSTMRKQDYIDYKMVYDQETTRMIVEPDLLDTIVNNPSQGHEDRETVFAQWESTKNPASSIKYFERINPIFLLSYARPVNWEHRRQFTATIATNLRAKLDASAKSIQYVGFKPDWMHQDLANLCTALESRPSASLDVHLIDMKQYKCFTGLRNSMQLSNQVNPNTDTDISDIMPDESLIKHKCSELKANSGKSPTDEEAIKMIKFNYTITENRARQLISFLKEKFPAAHLALHLHADVPAYREYIQKYSLPHPDVVCAADINSPEGQQLLSGLWYKILAASALDKNPDARNILLEDGNLCSFSLHQTDGATEQVVHDANTSITVFETKNEIKENANEPPSAA